MKFLKIYFSQTRFAHEKPIRFQYVMPVFHIFRNRYLFWFLIKNTLKVPLLVEKGSSLSSKVLKKTPLPIKLSTGPLRNFCFKKTVDMLWSFLCIHGDYLSRPQKRGFYPLLYPQFVHMIKVIDYKCLSVL